MGPSPHLWFLDAKRRLFDTNNKSLLVPDMTCRFVHENSEISTRFTSLYGSQPSSMCFASETATYGTELQVSIGPRRHLSFCVCKTA